MDLKLHVRGVQYLCGPVEFNSELHCPYATVLTLYAFCDVPRAPFESPREAILISEPTATIRSASLIAIACRRPEGVGLSSTGSKSTKSGSELNERWRDASPFPAGPDTLLGRENTGWLFSRSSQSSSELIVAVENESKNGSTRGFTPKNATGERGHLTPERVKSQRGRSFSRARVDGKGCASCYTYALLSLPPTA